MKRVVSVVTAVLTLVGGVVIARAPTAAAAGRCVTTHFVGVRASGESQGYGQTIEATRQAFLASARGRVSTFALVYPASNQPFLETTTTFQFLDSVKTGTENLRNYLIAYNRDCPKQDFVLTGYSQGALVIDRALSKAPPEVLARVTRVALFGDPIFSPKDSFDIGTFDPKKRGVIRTVAYPYAYVSQLPAAVRDRTQSYCVAGDPVCNYSVRNLIDCEIAVKTNMCAHQLYDDLGYTNTAGRYLAGRPSA